MKTVFRITGSALLALWFFSPQPVSARGFMDSDDVSNLLIAFLVALIIFLLVREVLCWYWKINQMVYLLGEINNKLDRVDKGMARTVGMKSTGSQDPGTYLSDEERFKEEEVKRIMNQKKTGGGT